MLTVTGAILVYSFKCTLDAGAYTGGFDSPPQVTLSIYETKMVREIRPNLCSFHIYQAKG